MLTRLMFWIMSRLGRDSRGLFLFYDGRRWRTVDGMETLRAFFQMEGFDWDNTPAKINQGIAVVQIAASKQIADAVRTVFKVKSTADGGLSEVQCLDLFWSFREYCDGVKKNGNLFPMSEESTEKPSQGIVIPPSLPLASTSISREPLPEPGGLTVEATQESSVS